MNSRILFFALALGALIYGCTKDPASSLYDPNANLGVQPVLTSITPEDGPYPIAGVTTLAIAGSNFITDTTKMIVWFDGVRAQILSAEPTLLRVRTPNFYKDSVNVRISIIGVDKFSEIKLFNIKPSIVNVAGIDYTKEQPWSVAVDRNENLFVSLASGTNGLGVYKITPAGVRSQIALKGTESFYSDLKIGPGDTLYAGRPTQPAIFYFNPATVTTPQIYVRSTTAPPLGVVEAFDYDAQRNIWAGGAGNPAIYRVNRAKKTTAFPFTGLIRSIRYFNSALYVAARTIAGSDTTEAVYQFAINPADTSLGAPVKYFDLTAAGYNSSKINAITFDSDGRLYVGISTAPGVLVVPAANAAATPLHLGLIGANVVYLKWGTGSNLYVVKSNSVTSQVLLKVDIQHQSAPYYGRQ